MERIVHIAKSYAEAEEWDIEQQVRMTPAERMRAARELKNRFFPKDSPDVRECRDETVRESKNDQ